MHNFYTIRIIKNTEIFDVFTLYSYSANPTSYLKIVTYGGDKEEHLTVTIDLLQEIASFHKHHSRYSRWWLETSKTLARRIQESIRDGVLNLELIPAGNLKVQHLNFGVISSTHLFGLDEFLIFAWYAVNQERYKKVLDLGGNIGVHSLVMSRLGYRVIAFEPDPIHIEYFNNTIRENDCVGVELRAKAIGTSNQRSNFTRVLGNTTGNHISGAKKDPYGELETIEVQVEAIQKVLDEGFDFIKMDVEGYEANLIEALSPEVFGNLEVMLEIGTPENASRIFEQLKRLRIKAFSQKSNWRRVDSLSNMPASHKEGSLMLSKHHMMNWR